ncbi:hypothetical protein [Rhizobium tumorigenes]|uniref:Uncharacterized protein n=1 Tax=Rhizobium tumorigenes TaxID=2041385 RepID=A0AAF1KEK9_9HYPH|nr:hypothetical protein [Rhizobium tumorigenes]WFR98731.1 hypothetical protein PR017_23815 [Rhizobium tumorigenes]
MDQGNLNEYLTLGGVFFSGIIMGLVGYLKKRPEHAEANPVLASVGLELGNRMQMDELIKSVDRIGDILEDKKQVGIKEGLKEILERMDEMEKQQTRRR